MIRTFLAFGFLGLITSPALAMENKGWAQIGKNPKTAQWGLWAKLYETRQVNDDSFEVRIRDDNGQDFPIKLNCRNKDWGIDKVALTSKPQWRQIKVKSGVGTLAFILCRHIDARDRWSMGPKNSYTWNLPKPSQAPGDLMGEWIEVTKDSQDEEFYNDEVRSDGKVVIFATYYRDKSLDYGERTSLDVDRYDWVAASCNKNELSRFHYTGEDFFQGFWIPTGSAKPGSAAMKVRREYCNKPNVSTINPLPIPTVADLQQYSRKR